MVESCKRGFRCLEYDFETTEDVKVEDWDGFTAGKVIADEKVEDVTVKVRGEEGKDITIIVEEGKDIIAEVEEVEGKVNSLLDAEIYQFLGTLKGCLATLEFNLYLATNYIFGLRKSTSTPA